MPDELGITAGAETNYNVTESHSFAGRWQRRTRRSPLDFDIQGVYAELDGQPTAWLGYTAGVRFDRNSKIDRRLSPRAALFVAKPEKYGVKLLYAEGFRNPSAFEGFFTDDTSYAANPDIRSETIRSFEGVLWAKPVAGLSTRLSAFYWDARDVVEQVTYQRSGERAGPAAVSEPRTDLSRDGVEAREQLSRQPGLVRLRRRHATRRSERRIR